MLGGRAPERLPARWWADHLEEIVASLALVVVVLATSWGVITRYITAQPATWAAEVSTIGFAWIVFFGAAACVKYRLHPAVDVPLERLPAALRAVLVWTNHALLLGFFAFMVWFGTRFAIDAWTNPSPVLRAPMTVLYGPVAVAFALMLVRYVQYVLLPRRNEAAGGAEGS
jgi:TRAP-type C4-dicarboxylate transport system permease small subunit